MERISRRELALLERTLSCRDRTIIDFLWHVRFAATSQIQRVFFAEYPSKATAQRLTRKRLNLLFQNSLIRPCNNRFQIGKRGSEENIWMLTEPGYRLLTLHDTHASRKQFKEPVLTTINHTVSITACYTEIVEITRASETLSLRAVEFEDKCWRRFVYQGKSLTLKPDLFFQIDGIIGEQKYTDSVFLEVDLSTEAISVIREKCHRYHQYRSTQLEQKKLGGFPFVIWLVPDDRRKQLIQKMMREAFIKHTKIFSVITPDELTGIVKGNIDFSKQL